MITDYKILTDSDDKLLEREVINKLKLGWKPLGGVSIAMINVGPVYIRYAQAMIKEEP